MFFYKLINGFLGWKYKNSPRDGKSYLILFKSGSIDFAFADDHCVNGWGKRDTWEDFDGDVIAYKKINMWCI